jgi:drug/metabolite transporter (DMT)-like permease
MCQRMTRIAGLVLIVVGLIAVIWGGFSYTKREKILDIGPIEASRTTEKHVPISPVIGVVTIIAGIAVIAAGKR